MEFYECRNKKRCSIDVSRREPSVTVPVKPGHAKTNPASRKKRLVETSKERKKKRKKKRKEYKNAVTSFRQCIYSTGRYYKGERRRKDTAGVDAVV